VGGGEGKADPKRQKQKRRERERTGQRTKCGKERTEGGKKTDKAVSSQTKKIQGEKTEGENNNITFCVFTNISMS